MAVSVNVGSATNDQAPIISGTIAPVFTDGIADSYSLAQFVTDPEGASLTYSITAGTLPSGVTLNASTGFLISDGGGTISTTTGIRFSVSDATNTEQSPEFSVVIQELAPEFTGSVSISTTEGTAGSYDFSQNFLNNVNSYAITGSLPAGFSFNTTTGLLSWTTSVVSGTTTGFSVTATNTGGSDVTPAFSIVVVGAFSGQVLLAADQWTTAGRSAELFYPRPDSETATWSKHRLHAAGVPFRVPLGVAFDSGLFSYELVSGPPGMFIQSFFTQSGGKYTWETDQEPGLLRWTNPTVGSHNWTVRVYFQSGGSLDISGTLVVNGINADTVWLDASAPSGGDGTFSNPYNSVQDILGPTLADTTYSGYQVCVRAGTYPAALTSAQNGGASGGNWVLNGQDKPLVWYAYSQEQVIFDMTDCTINWGTSAGTSTGGGSGSDWFMQGIRTINGPTARDNPKLMFLQGTNGDASVPYSGLSAGGSRMTWDGCEFTDFVNTTTSGNNAGVFWCANQDPNKRFYMYVSRCTFDNVRGDSASNVLNFNGFYISNGQNVLEEHTTCIGTYFGKGPVASKTGKINYCHRYIDLTQAPQQQHRAWLGGSYDPDAGGPAEYWYLKTRPEGLTGNGVTSSGVVANAGFAGSPYSASNPGHFEALYARCTLHRGDGPSTGSAPVFHTGDWPSELRDCLLVDDSAPGGSGLTLVGTTRYTIANDPTDSNTNITGSDVAIINYTIGAEVGTDQA